MTWDAYHRRKSVLREMLAIADLDPHRTLTDLLTIVDPLREVFADEPAVLFELQMLWLHRLTGHVDRLAVEGREPADLVAVSGWAAAAADLPGARALLDANADEPALAKARAKERMFLAASAGVSDVDALVESAREVTSRTSDAAEQRPGLIARLRSAIAA